MNAGKMQSRRAAFTYDPRDRVTLRLKDPRGIGVCITEGGQRDTRIFGRAE